MPGPSRPNNHLAKLCSQKDLEFKERSSHANNASQIPAGAFCREPQDSRRSSNRFGSRTASLHDRYGYRACRVSRWHSQGIWGAHGNRAKRHHNCPGLEKDVERHGAWRRNKKHLYFDYNHGGRARREVNNNTNNDLYSRVEGKGCPASRRTSWRTAHSANRAGLQRCGWHPLNPPLGVSVTLGTHQAPRVTVSHGQHVGPQASQTLSWWQAAPQTSQADRARADSRALGSIAPLACCAS